VVPIIISWFFSPIFTGVVSATFYGLTRHFVLLSKNSTMLSYRILPIMIFFVITIDIYFIFTRGAKKQLASDDDWSNEKALWISAVIGAGCALISFLFGIPFLKSKLKNRKGQQANFAEKGPGGVLVPIQMANSAARAIDSASPQIGWTVEVLALKCFLQDFLFFSML
jgi:hypothetical protein